MELPTALASIVIALTLGAMSPGPSFVMVARTALAVSRRDALAAALGMGAGGALFACFALLGLLALLAAVPMLYMALKIAGGLYLLYLGLAIWRGARQPLSLGETDAAPTPRVGRSFLTGFATQISNPKTAVVYASVFASLLPPQVPTPVLVALPFTLFLIETSWYAIVAVALSAPAPRARYLAARTWIDRSAGTIMILLGGKLLLGGRAP